MSFPDSFGETPMRMESQPTMKRGTTEGEQADPAPGREGVSRGPRSLIAAPLLPRPRLFDLVGLFFAVHLLLGGGSLLGDPGIGWHLRAGELIASGGPPEREPFTLVSLGDEPAPLSSAELCADAGASAPPAVGQPKRWIHDQWLSDLIFWKLFDLDGGRSLRIGAALVLLLAYVGVLAALCSDEQRERSGIPAPIAETLLLLLIGMNGAVQWFIRPMLFSFLCAGVLLVLLRRELCGRADRCIWFVPAMFALWANLHGGFIIGFGLLCAAAFCAAFERRGHALRRIIITGLLSGAATLLNPWGVALHLNLFSLLGSPFFMNLNMEWLPPDFNAWLFVPFLAVLLLLVGAFLTGVLGTLSLFDRLCAIGAVAVALTQRRYIPFFALFAAVPLLRVLVSGREFFSPRGALRAAAESIGRKEAASPRTRYTFLCWAIVGLSIGAKGCGDDSKFALAPRFPESAVNLLLAQARPGDRVFHTPDWGGYLIYRGWPKIVPFLDDRNQLHGEDPYVDFFRIAGGLSYSSERLEYYGFRWLLLQPEMPLREMVERDSRWEKVETGSKDAILFRRRCSGPTS